METSIPGKFLQAFRTNSGSARLSSFVVNLRSTSRHGGAGPAPLSSTIFSVP